MDTKTFDQILANVSQTDEIVHGELHQSRGFQIDVMTIKNIHTATGLSQAKFARMVGRVPGHYATGSRDDVSQPGPPRH